MGADSKGLTAGEKLTDLLTAQYMKKGNDLDTARAMALKDKAQMVQYKKDLNVEYAKLGGDVAYSAGLAKGVGLFAKSVADRAKHSLVGEMLQAEFGVDGRRTKDQDSLIGEFNRWRDPLTREQAQNSIATKDRQRASALKAYREGLMEGLSEGIADYAHGEEILRHKIGDKVPKADADAILRHYRNAKDGNLRSTNPDSLGYLTNQIIQHYAGQGGLDNPQCRAEVEQLKIKMDADLDAHLAQFEARNAKAIREHRVAQKHREEMDAVDTMATMTNYQRQREDRLRGMDLSSVNLVIGDSLVQRMHDAGDYAGAGLKIQLLVDGVKRHDDEAVKQLGFDAQTVAALKKWETEGKTARLDGIRNLGVFDAAYMGNGSAKMGGSSMHRMQSTLANLTSVAEKKIISEKFATAINSYLGQETTTRAEVKRVVNSIAHTFSGAEWGPIYAQVRGLDGRAVANAQEFTSALNATLNAISDGAKTINDPIVKGNLAALVNFRSQNQNNFAITNAVNLFQQGIASAQAANDYAGLANDARSVKNRYDGQIRNILPKIVDFEQGTGRGM